MVQKISNNLRKKTKKIFISYRREDSSSDAGRLYDRLKSLFPHHHFFMDTDSILGAEDFSERIFSTISTCDIFICLIGPNWVHNKDGVDRLQSEDDFIRREVEAALQVPSLSFYPVLLGETKMPDAKTLPESMQPVTAINAVEIRHSRFNDDFDYLAEQIFSVNRNTFGTEGLTIRLGKAILKGIPSSAIVLFLLAQLNSWITNKSLSQVLGQEITVVLLIIIPLVIIGLFYNKKKS